MERNRMNTEKNAKTPRKQKHVEEHVRRIQELSADLNKTDVEKRYAIAREVKAIYDAKGKTGMKYAAKHLKRWSSKTLYEYKAVAKEWDAAAFDRISAEVGPTGNALVWSDYVGLTYVADSEREGVRKQALAEGVSVKILKKPRSTAKAGEAPETVGDDRPEAAGALPSVLCKILNDVPIVMDVLKTAMILLEPPTPENATAEIKQLRMATAEQLELLRTCIDEGVPMLRQIAESVESTGPRIAGLLPAGRNDAPEEKAAE
jgi:hypothetical protein